MFLNIACDMCNEYFSPEKVNALIDSFALLIEKEYPFMASQRWYGSSISQKSYSNWKNENLKTLYDYAKIRPQVFMNLLKNTITGASELVPLEIVIENPQHGSVTINSIPIDSQETSWVGYYFAGCDIPMKIKATDGYRYSIGLTEGEAAITSTNITMKSNTGVKVTISFIN